MLNFHCRFEEINGPGCQNKIATRLEGDPTKVTVQTFLEECYKLQCIKQDASTSGLQSITPKPQATVKKIKQQQK
jgi:hypothetical protein